MAIDSKVYKDVTNALVHGDSKTTIEFINNGGTVELVHFAGTADENVAPITEQKEQLTLSRGSALRITATGSAKVSVVKIEG